MTASSAPFTAPYAPDDGEIAARLMALPQLTADQNVRIDRTAARLIAAIRAADSTFGGVEDVLREFSQSTKEGLALMVMAEALLRVPDDATVDRFIEDNRATSRIIRRNARVKPAHDIQC